MTEILSGAPSPGRQGERDPDGIRRSAARILADRNFAPLFVGNLLSNCGTWVQNIALVLLVYRLTGSTLAVGLVNFAQFAGIVLLAPWTGSAADRFDRRRLLIVSQLAALLITGALAVVAATDRASAPVAIAFALLLGVATAFATPALHALLPSLVRPADLGAAVAMNSVTFNTARAVGPALGALIVDRLGIPWAFALNSLSYAALIVALLVVRPAARTPADRSRPRLRDSLRLVRERPQLAILLGVIAVVAITIDPVTTLTPAFATLSFGSPDTVAGYLAAAFGVGAVMASLLPWHGSAAALGVRPIALPLGVLVIGMAAFALAPSLPLALVALGIAGAGFLLAQTRATTLLQLSVDDRERGRVMALWGIAFLGSRPLASVTDGALATVLGPRAAALLLLVPATAAVLLLRFGGERPARGVAHD
jgi:MFS family permease